MTQNPRFRHEDIRIEDEDELPPGAGILLSMIVGSGLWGIIGWFIWG